MSRPTERLHLDRIACTGHGVCATILPELVRLDEWGYPVLEPVIEASDHNRPVLKAAVKMCPARALRLIRGG